jgi:hypothetical protein
VKNLLVFISFIILFSISAVPAQVSPATGVRSSDAAPSAVSAGGKVTLPPEKASAVRIPRAMAAAMTIDGHVDEDAWKQAAVFKDFYQTSPGYNAAPSKATEAYLMYDERNLYLAFKCWDDRDKIRATVAKRDSLGNDDNVRVWLDTYFDRRRAYVLWFNPLGIQQDGIYTEGQGADFSPDIVMESKGVHRRLGLVGRGEDTFQIPALLRR